jgi:myo-inositol-1(or 4)-monophosphatase
MDRTVIPSEHPLDLSHADESLRSRILAGQKAVLGQVGYFRENFGKAESRWKGDGTRVTVVDETISREIFTNLTKDFSEDDFCSEENDSDFVLRDLHAEFAWVLDPVDGTNNYAVGIPECGISLGLLREGMPVYGFIYDNGRDLLLQGGPGFGAVEGDSPIRAATDLVNEKLTFCMHFPIPSEAQDKLKEALTIWRIRCPGSAAVGLANVAAGRLDGCIEYRSKPWDCAAGHPICRGAGADFHFLEEACFPMKSFSTSMPSFPFRVGSQLFLDETAKVLD